MVENNNAEKSNVVALHREDSANSSVENLNIYERLGETDKEKESALTKIVQSSTPISRRLFDKSFRVNTYRAFMQSNFNLEELGDSHAREYEYGNLEFRKKRPLFRKVRKILKREYNIE
ncbi:MAG: hypothetical protein WDZ77_00245 [Candidatus Pacearchaeota archaeon]